MLFRLSGCRRDIQRDLCKLRKNLLNEGFNSIGHSLIVMQSISACRAIVGWYPDLFLLSDRNRYLKKEKAESYDPTCHQWEYQRSGERISSRKLSGVHCNFQACSSPYSSGQIHFDDPFQTFSLEYGRCMKTAAFQYMCACHQLLQYPLYTIQM